MGLVAQRIRARGYEPRCRGFESLLAHNRPKREGPFPPGGRKIMLGIADSKLWNLVGDGSFVEIEWSGLLFYLNLDIYIYYIYRLFFFLHIVFLTSESAYFSKPRNSSSARLGQNSRASTSISSIEKMRSSSLSH